MNTANGEPGALEICMNFSRFLSDVPLMIFMTIKFQWDFKISKARNSTLMLS